MFVQMLNRLARIFLFTLVLVLIAPAMVSADDATEEAEVPQMSVAEMVVSECKDELEDYCSTVTPGRGRYAACLYAHNDQLSEQCEIAFEVGLIQLQVIMSTVRHVVEQCRPDLDKHCVGAQVGGGHVYQCLSEHRATLAKSCQQAFTQAENDLQ